MKFLLSKVHKTKLRNIHEDPSKSFFLETSSPKPASKRRSPNSNLTRRAISFCSFGFARAWTTESCHKSKTFSVVNKHGTKTLNYEKMDLLQLGATNSIEIYVKAEKLELDEYDFIFCRKKQDKEETEFMISTLLAFGCFVSAEDRIFSFFTNLPGLSLYIKKPFWFFIKTLIATTTIATRGQSTSFSPFPLVMDRPSSYRKVSSEGIHWTHAGSLVAESDARRIEVSFSLEVSPTNTYYFQ
ncbi:hypothetical protein CAEBREN_16725 [Caenorhabditis brenneri]|uniref:Uncharacterized protein n=1 Tax=Caenorhabditis brenneri TaxID=135651 RepID=G0P407_CAEBE|nr:hypothetical protein CAEBREN_16725 [Caenorhabditis brenneri]